MAPNVLQLGVMKFLSVRELRNRPGRVWERLLKEDLVLTANGRPVGVLVGVDEGRLEETVTTLRRARAMLAVSRMRRRAAETGADKLTPAEIDREIRKVRRQRRSA